MANYAVSVSADSKVTVNASNTLSATKGAVFISNKRIKKPKLAKKLTVTRKGRKTTVKWNKVKNASGYYIYRTRKKGGKYQLIATVNKNSKTTFSETTKKKYYYKVSPYKQYKNSIVIGDKKA
jgi:fibronectin type 3 domain-containing protein